MWVKIRFGSLYTRKIANGPKWRFLKRKFIASFNMCVGEKYRSRYGLAFRLQSNAKKERMQRLFFIVFNC